MDLDGSELVIKAENRRYRVVEAVRILSEVSGAPDLHEIVGKVKSLNFLSELGAELLGNSMVLGDNAYEIMPGFLGTAIGAFSDHLAQRNDVGHDAVVLESEEALLAQYLLRALE